MSAKKRLAYAVMLTALVAILVGMNFVNNCYSQETKFCDPIYNKSIVVPADGYSYLFTDLNCSGALYYSVTVNGSLRVDWLRQSIYPAWLNGSYQPAFSTLKEPSANENNDYAQTYINNYPEPTYFVFWNSNSSANIEVTLRFCQQTTQQVYSAFTFNVGVFLVAAGAVSGLAAPLMVSKRLFLSVTALTLLISGAIMFVGNSNFSHNSEGYCLAPLIVPADGYAYEPLMYNQTGDYMFGMRVINGTINSAVLSLEEFNDYRQGKYAPDWRSWNNVITIDGLPSKSNSNLQYLVFYNTDAYDKQIEMAIEHVWDSCNLSAVVAGPLLIMVGAALFWAANKRQIKVFNRELDVQG